MWPTPATWCARHLPLDARVRAHWPAVNSLVLPQACMDQPASTLDMVQRWIEGKPFN
jgi:hypothetical protein